MGISIYPPPGAFKSVQRGVIAIANGTTTGTATVTSVNTSKAKLRMLGSYQGANLIDALVGVVLTNSTTVTATRAGAAGVCSVSWELEDVY